MNDNMIKQFRKGVLEMIVLKLLSNREMYGYELAAELNKESGPLNIKEGTLYPILYRLEDDGLMESRWDQAVSRGQPKKYYSLTAKGERALREAYAQWKAIAQDVTRIMEACV